MTNFATYPSLRGRGVLVTGGATGIGAGIVEHFAAQGARVGFIDLDAEAAERLTRSLGKRARMSPSPAPICATLRRCAARSSPCARRWAPSPCW